MGAAQVAAKLTFDPVDSIQVLAPGRQTKVAQWLIQAFEWGADRSGAAFSCGPVRLTPAVIPRKRFDCHNRVLWNIRCIEIAVELTFL